MTAKIAKVSDYKAKRDKLMRMVLVKSGMVCEIMIVWGIMVLVGYRHRKTIKDNVKIIIIFKQYWSVLKFGWFYWWKWLRKNC